MKGWPQPYHDEGPEIPPSWTRAQAVKAGLVLANRMLNDRGFALSYLNVVKRYYEHNSGQLLDQYATLIETANPDADMSAFNANDFANVHRAAWLYLFQAFCCLVDKNLHGKDNWGDPPKDDTSHGSADRDGGIDNVHNIPNDTGYFAINSIRDVPAPAIDDRPARARAASTRKRKR